MTQTTSPRPERSGLDLSASDSAVRPQDDLYRHVNGAWLREYVIPADRSRDGAFIALRDQSEERVRTLLEAAAESSTLGALYRSFLDSDATTAGSMAALDPDIAPVLAATTRAELATVLGTLERSGIGSPVGIHVENDAADTSRMTVYLSQSGLGLPDEAYYREEKYAEILSAYREHIAKMARLAQWQGPEEFADSVVETETAIAKGHWTVASNRDADKTHNPSTLPELARELAPEFNWAEWTAALVGSATQFPGAHLIVQQPSALAHFAQLWASLPLERWQQWTLWHILRRRAPYLAQPFVAENFEFYGRRLTGAEELRAPWKRAVALVESLAGEEVGKLYVERHFPAESKTRMLELVRHLLEAYRRNIAQLEWMTPQTREKALAKLATFTPKIGYPDEWKKLPEIGFDAKDLLGNVRRGNARLHDYELGKVAAGPDPHEWYMTPQTVNAYYHPLLNEIVFPAAILEPPFFDPTADDAMNFGGIGAVVGHEIGHGFDDQGSKFDGQGNLNNWWSDADRSAFELRTKALIDQYDAFTPDGLDPAEYHVNGALTIGENIGDLGGLSIAIVAYKLAVSARTGKDLADPTLLADEPTIDGLTPLQRVFWAWATVWRTAIRTQEAIRLLSIDPHSPAEFRCNGIVSNLDEFYEAFDVTPADKLWLDPEDRVTIW